MSDQLRVQVSEAGADAERLEAVTRHLRSELGSLDDADVSTAPDGEAPAGSRAVDPVAVGGLVVSLLGSSALRAVVLTVRGWLRREESGRAVRLELDGDVLELAGASSAEQERLLEVFLARHGADGPATSRQG